MKKSTLDDALQEHFGDRLYMLLASENDLPTLCRIAAEDLFIDPPVSVRIRGAEIIREALSNLRREGEFNFDEEDESDGGR